MPWRLRAFREHFYGCLQRRGDTIRLVFGSSGDDTVTGTGGPDDIIDDAGPDFDTGPDTDTIVGAQGNDLLDVEDGDGDDTVTCGAGNDTVFFDEGAEGDTLVVPDDCEEKNPPRPDLVEEQAATYRAQIQEVVPDSVLEGSGP